MTELTEYMSRWAAVADAKTELESIRLIDGQINARNERLIRLRQQCLNCARWPKGERVQGGSDHDVMTQLLDMELDLKYDLEHKLQLIRDIEGCINRIDDPLLSEILIQRYIDQLEWNTIAVNVKYGPGYCRTYLHLLAVEEYKRVRNT